MVRIGQWAGRVGLTNYYGVTVEELNDDRLGRALERLTPMCLKNPERRAG
jgi:hypothetical protein